MIEIEIHKIDDWEAVYKNGKLVDQHHTVPIDTVLKAAEVKYKIVWHDNDPAFDDYRFSEFPDTLEKLSEMVTDPALAEHQAYPVPLSDS